jgi:hypothetical protein
VIDDTMKNYEEKRLNLSEYTPAQEADLMDKFNRLKKYIEMTPQSRSNNFVLKSANAGVVDMRGMVRNDKLIMDQINLGANATTLWSIQKSSIRFVVYWGQVDLKFRVGTQVHIAGLSTTHSLQLKAGIPFKLETFESHCEVLLISSNEGISHGQ